MKEKIKLLAINAEGTPTAGETAVVGIHESHGKRISGERPPIESGTVREPEINFLKALGEKLIGPKIQRTIPPAMKFDE